jgi:hypothetical protein
MTFLTTLHPPGIEVLSDQPVRIERAAGSIVRKLTTSFGERPLSLAQSVHD